MLEVFEVTDLEVAFSNADKMPSKEEIPKEFWRGDTKWNKIFSQMFFSGGKFTKMTPKEGVDSTKAMRAIKSIMGSWSPKHEHKDAAVAFMLSEWFDELEFAPEKAKQS